MTLSGCAGLVDLDPACGTGEEIGHDRLVIPPATRFVAVQRAQTGPGSGVSASPPLGPMDDRRAQQGSMTWHRPDLVAQHPRTIAASLLLSGAPR